MPPLASSLPPEPGATVSTPAACVRCSQLAPQVLAWAPRVRPEAAPSPSLLLPSEWIRDYTDSVLDPEALRVEVDAFMEAYDRKTAEVGLA